LEDQQQQQQQPHKQPIPSCLLFGFVEMGSRQTKYRMPMMMAIPWKNKNFQQSHLFKENH
jgi:hypothetical protein